MTHNAPSVRPPSILPLPPSMILHLRSADFTLPPLPASKIPVELHPEVSVEKADAEPSSTPQDKSDKEIFDIEKELGPVIAALSLVKAIRVDADDAEMHKCLARIFASDQNGLERWQYKFFVNIKGLSASTHKGDPFMVANPITPPIKNLICRVLHDLGETYIDVLLIEGPYATEEAAQSYLQATEAFAWKDGPVRMVGLSNFAEEKQIRFMFARSKQPLAVVQNSWSPLKGPLLWSIHDLCAAYGVHHQLEMNSADFSALLTSASLLQSAEMRGLSAWQYLIKLLTALDITAILNAADVQLAQLSEGTQDAVIERIAAFDLLKQLETKMHTDE